MKKKYIGSAACAQVFVLIVGHVTRSCAKLGVGFDDFVDGFQEILFSGHLPAGSDGEHSSFRAHGTNLSTCHVTNQKPINSIPAVKRNGRNALPVLLGHKRASNSKRMSRSTLMERAWILKMCVRPSRSGRPNSTLRSKRPGRIRAGSRVSGRFVAIRT